VTTSSQLPPRDSRAGRTRERALAALAGVLALAHFASYDVASLPIATDARYFLYFAWRIAEGALPHVDLFDNKTFGASVAGALFYRLGAAVGVDPLAAIRAGFLAIAALGGWLAYFVHRRLGGDSATAGFLGLLAYCGYGLIGLLAALGPLPKLSMAVLASAMGLLAQRGRWLAAGLAGGAAFLDWQVGGLVWLAAFAAALRFGRPRGGSALRVALGGAAVLLPAALCAALRGGLSAALEQTLVASLFRGASTLARRDLSARLERIAQVVEWSSGGREWLVYAGLLGLPVALFWLWSRRRDESARLLFPLCIYHGGVLAFSAVDFQGYADLALALHSVAFLAALAWIALASPLLRLARGAGPRAGLAAGALVLAAACAVARPAVLRPALELTLRDERVDYTLEDQREVAARVAELAQGRRLLFLDASELLFLMRRANTGPVIFWNDAVWRSFRSDEHEAPLATAERLVREADPDLLAWPPRLGGSDLLAGFAARRVESRSGRYGVDLWLR
jgi:hypothetical protein